jgi:uncharacterized protein (TIGR02722 family)
MVSMRLKSWLKIKSMIRQLLLVSLLFFLSFSCSRSVTRISPETDIDLSGRWNDADSRKVADQMIYDLFNSDDFKNFAASKGSKPVIVVGYVRNKTSEHIDSDNYVRKMEVVIHNSNVADVVESSVFRDEIRKERAEQQDFADPATVKKFGKELGADLMLLGDMTSETDVYNKKRVVNYITTLFLTDIETNRRVWYGQHEIKKLVKN